MSYLVVGNHTQGLGVIRSLGNEGIKGHVLYDKEICLARFSKHTKSFTRTKRNTISDAFNAENHQAILSSMMSLVPDGEKWVLFGVNEDVINFFYENQNTLREKYLFPKNPIKNIVDKYEFAKLTTQIGITTPATYLLGEAAENMLPGRQYVAKGRQGNKFRSLGNLKGKTLQQAGQLQSMYEYVQGRLNETEVIIQELIVAGEDARVRSFCGFSIEGAPYAEFQYEKVRQSPEPFGTGTYSKSIWDDQLAQLGRKIIDKLGYTGIFEIEFLQNANGQYAVIEMNPRPWKGIGLAVASNRNLAYYYYNFLAGDSLPPRETLKEYLPNKSWAHIATDVISMIKKGRFDFGYKDIVFCDYDKSDIKPFLAEIFLAPFIAAKF